MSLKIADVRALASDISSVENESSRANAILSKAWKNQTGAYRVGITGPPGAGKSTLVNCLAVHFTDMGLQTAVIMVDPSSPFSGGAVLGDRIRISSLSSNPNLFIRSMATRGSLGGLSTKTGDVCDLLDSYGFDIILVETVGVGQIELDVAQTCDVTVTVFVPESGDDIQAMKAGLMEITDIFIVNKADREGVRSMMINLQSLLSLKEMSVPSDWKSPVLKSIASKNKGTADISKEIFKYKKYLESKKLWNKIRHERKKRRTMQYIKHGLIQKAADKMPNLDHEIEGPDSPFQIAIKYLKSIKMLDITN